MKDVDKEVARQNRLWGDQTGLRDGTGGEYWEECLRAARATFEQQKTKGDITWLNILEEEIMEAFVETDVKLLREELVQCGAVIQQWIRAIDRRSK